MNSSMIAGCTILLASGRYANPMALRPDVNGALISFRKIRGWRRV